MTIDINELREAIQTFGSQAINEDDLNELLDRLEAAEKEYQHVLEVKEIYQRQLNETEEERDALRTALEKIADWDSAWGPYPETNEAWRAMAIVTAREAVPRKEEKK